MSLLNKMLRDLEHRRSGDGVEGAALEGVKAVESAGASRKRPMLWIALLVVAAASAAALSQHLPGFSWSAKERKPTPAPKTATLPANRSPAAGNAPVALAASGTPARAGETGAQASPAPETTLLGELRIAADIESTIHAPNAGEAGSSGAPVPPIRVTKEGAGEVVPHAAVETAKGIAAVEPHSVAPAPVVVPARVAARTGTGGSAVALAPPSSPAEIEYNTRAPDARQRAHDAVESGLQAFGRKQFTEAQRAFRSALELEPANDRGRQALLSVLLAIDDKPAAEAVADEGMLQGAAKVGFALVSARLKLERGAVKEALAVLERERTAGARHADYQALWGNALSREARYPEAAQRYAAAVELAPASPAHHVGLGYALRNDGQFASAYAVFQSVAEMPGLSPQLADLVEQQLAALQRLVVRR